MEAPSESDTTTTAALAYEAADDFYAFMESMTTTEESHEEQKSPSESDTYYLEAFRSDFRNLLKSVVNEEQDMKKTSKRKIESKTTPAEIIHFTDLPEKELMALFSEVPLFRFEVCKVFLSFNDDESCKRQLFLSYNKDCRKRQLFGVIEAAIVSRDPGIQQYGSFNIFNRKFNNPIVVTNLGYLSPHNISYCSLPVSTSVKITAQLYVTTDKLDDMESYTDYQLQSDNEDEDDDAYDGYDFEEQSDFDLEDTFVETHKLIHTERRIDNYAFEICNDSAVINFSDSFAKRPYGGSGCYISKGKDGYLELHYVALKYAVDAALEVEFVTSSKEKEVAGRIMAYYGKSFDYGCPPHKKDLYNAMLFQTKPHEYFKSGKINLMRSVLAVPAKFSLIIDANLRDFASGDIILSGTYEFVVPRDGKSAFGSILSDDCSLNLKVDWKLPFGA